MDSIYDVPPEIVFLCTTSETKEKAFHLLSLIRHSDVHKELKENPAVPAICCLIASEQLGNTVVSERRALQLSRSTPEQFKIVMNQVQKILISSKELRHPVKPSITLHSLTDEFSIDQDTLTRMLAIEKAFGQACANRKWAIDSEIVQLAIFAWSCHHFKIHTLKSLENLWEYYSVSPADFEEINNLLDKYCLSIPVASSSNIAIGMLLNPESSASGLSTNSAVKLEDLANEFKIGEDVLKGMRYLERIVGETADLEDIMDWSSTMGRCVIFYWTCSVLKIAGAKQITLRKQYKIKKKEFDKAITALDTQRGDLRNRLETYHAGISPQYPSPQRTQWPAISLAKSQIAHVSPVLEAENPTSVVPTCNMKKGTGKRGRPPKVRLPPTVISMVPVTGSRNERILSSLCAGRVLTRGLLLLRSLNARKHPGGEATRVPTKALPPLIAFIASQQICDSQVTEARALQLSGLSVAEFDSALNTVRITIDIYETGSTFASITLFDDMALEHGLSIHVVLSMMQVREALKVSQCLSDGMEWDSALVRCSVFFWTCAILKVPDVNQSLLRSRSLASKREFDSMLQLLNSHCSTVRHRLEVSGSLVFAPAPHSSQTRQTTPLLYVEQESHLDDGEDRQAKRVKRETLADVAQASHSQSRKEYKRSRLSSQIRYPTHGAPGGANGSFTGSDSLCPSKAQFPPADWEPPESPSMDEDNIFESSGCPASETGESKRRHTRYSTKDYTDIAHDRLRVWKPSGDEMADRQSHYRRWEERMTMDYGPQWEKNIKHKPPGIPFE